MMGVMHAPDTVTEALRLLRDDGYVADFELIDGAIRWEHRTNSCAVDAVVVERLFRFEGPSDPGDEMVVFGLYDPVTGARGALASGFGPSADPDMLDHLVGLASRHEA